jgi:hypothetical protein
MSAKTAGAVADGAIMEACGNVQKSRNVVGMSQMCHLRTSLV